MKKYKVYDDPNGGVKPLEERIEAATKLIEPKLLLIQVEAECRKHKDTECKKVCVAALWWRQRWRGWGRKAACVQLVLCSVY